MSPPIGEGVLAATLKEALRLRDLARAEGATQAELDTMMEKTLRSAWPQVREWKYLCSLCDDTGLITKLCRRGARCNGISSRSDTWRDPPGKYQRACAVDPLSDERHDYGVPCTCSRGTRFKEKPKAGPEDFSHEAGRSTGKPSRFGR